MGDAERSGLEANLRKYQLFILLQKRAFLPVIGIFLVSIAKLSLIDISTIASITALVRIVLEVPTGYFADRFGRKYSTVIGSFLVSFSPLAYVISPDYWGGLAAWTSLKHIELMMHLEKAFAIRFSKSEMINLKSFREAVSIISSKLQKMNP